MKFEEFNEKNIDIGDLVQVVYHITQNKSQIYKINSGFVYYISKDLGNVYIRKAIIYDPGDEQLQFRDDIDGFALPFNQILHIETIKKRSEIGKTLNKLEKLIKKSKNKNVTRKSL